MYESCGARNVQYLGPAKEVEHRTKQWMSDDSWQMALLYLPAQLCNAFASSAVVPESAFGQTWIDTVVTPPQVHLKIFFAFKQVSSLAFFSFSANLPVSV